MAVVSDLNMSYPFSQEDFNRANREWGCNCGPSALAFALQLPLDSVRAHIPDFDRRRYTSPTMMKQALASLGVGFEQVMHMFWSDAPTLTRIQFTGPWTQPGSNPRWAYRHTHWIVCWKHLFDDMLFDCNGGINTIEQWQRDVLPHLLPKRSYGWCPTHCWKIARPSKEAGHA